MSKVNELHAWTFTPSTIDSCPLVVLLNVIVWLTDLKFVLKKLGKTKRAIEVEQAFRVWKSHESWPLTLPDIFRASSSTRILSQACDLVGLARSSDLFFRWFRHFHLHFDSLTKTKYNSVNYKPKHTHHNDQTHASAKRQTQHRRAPLASQFDYQMITDSRLLSINMRTRLTKKLPKKPVKFSLFFLCFSNCLFLILLILPYGSV